MDQELWLYGYSSHLSPKVKAEVLNYWLMFDRVHVFHLTAPEVLAQLHSLTAIAEATETPRSV